MLQTVYTLIFFFFNAPATTELYTLSLHDALPIYRLRRDEARHECADQRGAPRRRDRAEGQRVQEDPQQHGGGPRPRRRRDRDRDRRRRGDRRESRRSHSHPTGGRAALACPCGSTATTSRV